MKIEITTDSDEHECDCCGTTYAQGGTVVVDGVEILSRPALAYCTGSDDWNQSELLVMALHKMGHKVSVDGEPYHVTRHDEEYHGPMPSDTM